MGTRIGSERQNLCRLAVDLCFQVSNGDLNGKTPREAARTRQGRKALETLLRSIENTEDRCRRRGEAAYDVSILRRELDL